jgi:hypothetical protein
MARGKPCKNKDCSKRARPGSKYCSDDCGRVLAARTASLQEVKQIQQNLAAVQEERTRVLSAWMQEHPNYLTECTHSVSTKKDLDAIEDGEKQLKGLRAALVKTEKDFEDARLKVKTAEVQRTLVAPGLLDEVLATNRLDCSVCGKDVATSSYVSHLRECMQRNEEFSHSTVTQNPGLCNFLSRRTNRYCSLPKQSCVFHAPGHQLDYQFLLCGYHVAGGDLCRTPALQCLVHADWRDVLLKGVTQRKQNLEERILATESAVANAKRRIAYREILRENKGAL